MTAIEDAALAWHNAGYCVLPAASDGSKRPGVGSWDKYKTERPDRATLRAYLNHADGIGLVCGAVSGNLEMLEIEGAAAEDFVPFLTAVTEVDPVLAGALTSYVERTPSGGYHFLYRVDGPVAGNTKLASRPREPTPDSPSRRQVKMETRGEGGWTICAPSAGQTHPSGGAWEIQNGTAGVLATLRPEQRDLLHAIAMSFDEMPPPEPPGASSVADGAVRAPTNAAAEGTPGADFTERSTWEEILAPHGWRRIYSRGEVTYWQRPGKTDRSVSASTGHQGDWLYVFTTSTEFEAERTYTRFGAYAVLEHNGDFSAAASALRKSGYGATTSRPAPAARHLTVVPTEEHSSVGAAALAPRSVPVITSLTERGNADAMVAAALARGDLLYSPRYKGFYTWGGNRWVLSPADDLTRAVQLFNEVIDAIKVTDDAVAKHKIKSMGWRSARDSINFFKATPAVQVGPDDMDNRPLELNTPAGVVHLLTGEFRPSTPADRHTKLTGVSPDFTTVPHRWLAFLDETFGGDADMIGYIQRLAGYSMTGAVTHEIMPFLYGSGANGKSVLLVVFADVLGEYASSAPPDFLLARSMPAHETEIARLHGQRFVICSEVPHNARFNEGRMKMLCSQENITAHFMGKDHITFRPSHHLWLAGNHEPSVPGGGNGFWRRFRKIPFHHTVPADRQDTELAAKLVAAEGPAIMAWMIEGAKAQAHGLADPPEVLVATEEYASSEDQLGRFLTECVSLSPAVQGEETKRVSDAYNRWCSINNERPAFLGPRLGRELKARGFVRQDSNGKAFYREVVLHPPEGQPDGPTQEEIRYGK